MKTINIPFVYCNKIFYLSYANNCIEIRDQRNSLTVKKTVDHLKSSTESIDLLAYRIYTALVRECSVSVSAKSDFKQF